MTVQYTNRVGTTYYLREGKTKKGNPRYHFSAKKDGKGDAVEQMPDGYEIYEHPENAQVFLRKKCPQLFTDLEKKLIEKQIDKLTRPKRYLMDCKDEFITIYESNADIGGIGELFAGFLKNLPTPSGMGDKDVMDILSNVGNEHYTAMMRFRLVDKESRTFTAERFCFRGAIDDWILLDGPSGDLKKLSRKYIPLLGTEELFDSPYL